MRTRVHSSACSKDARASTIKPASSTASSTSPDARPKDAGYLAHMADQLASQMEILHVFATQNPESCNSALAGAIGVALNAAAALSRELDVLEAAE